MIFSGRRPLIRISSQVNVDMFWETFFKRNNLGHGIRYAGNWNLPLHCHVGLKGRTDSCKNMYDIIKHRVEIPRSQDTIIVNDTFSLQ
jgi:hypothetical protein